MKGTVQSMQNMTVADAIHLNQHLNQLHTILDSGLLHEADADMIETALTELEMPMRMLDRFERPMSWEKPMERTIAGRMIHEDEMADYKNQQVEEMIEREDREMKIIFEQKCMRNIWLASL